VTLADIAPSVATLTESGSRLREAVRGLTGAHLDTRYKNWTVRQIAYHLGDSHMNVYIRWMVALTEDVPTIKPYSEGAWSEVAASRTGDIETALALVDAVHARWMGVVGTCSMEQMHREFFHPEMNERVRLVDTLRVYAWHVEHHIGQILWMRRAHGWG